MNYAPIALFVYRRPEHTRRTIESLMQCPEFDSSPIYVFADAAKKPEHEEKVQETRAIVAKMLGQRAKIVEAQTNQGLAKSIIAGVDTLLAKYDRVIVLEDDLVVSPRFLNYMNTALTAYQDEPSVMQVSGYMFPVKEFINATDAIFLPFTSSWGWGTWRRAWQHFDPLATGWEVMKTDTAMRSQFNLDGACDYFEMIKTQMSGKADSWAIRWYWSVFKNNGYVVYPPISHVNNIGLDGSGTHGAFTGKELRSTKYHLSSSSSENFPLFTQESQESYQIIVNTIKNINSGWRSNLKKFFYMIAFWR